MKMEQPECSETLAYKIQMPANYPEESIQQRKASLLRCEELAHCFSTFLDMCIMHLFDKDIL
jgi:hypothetical protein